MPSLFYPLDSLWEVCKHTSQCETALRCVFAHFSMRIQWVGEWGHMPLRAKKKKKPPRCLVIKGAMFLLVCSPHDVKVYVCSPEHALLFISRKPIWSTDCTSGRSLHWHGSCTTRKHVPCGLASLISHAQVSIVCVKSETCSVVPVVICLHCQHLGQERFLCFFSRLALSLLGIRWGGFDKGLIDYYSVLIQ